MLCSKDEYIVSNIYVCYFTNLKLDRICITPYRDYSANFHVKVSFIGDMPPCFSFLFIISSFRSFSFSGFRRTFRFDLKLAKHSVHTKTVDGSHNDMAIEESIYQL